MSARSLAWRTSAIDSVEELRIVFGLSLAMCGEWLRWAMVGVVLSLAVNGFGWAFTRLIGSKHVSAQELRKIEVELAAAAKDGDDWSPPDRTWPIGASYCLMTSTACDGGSSWR